MIINEFESKISSLSQPTENEGDIVIKENRQNEDSISTESSFISDELLSSDDIKARLMDRLEIMADNLRNNESSLGNNSENLWLISQATAVIKTSSLAGLKKLLEKEEQGEECIKFIKFALTELSKKGDQEKEQRSNTVVVTRHPALVRYLEKTGLIEPGTSAIDHVEPQDIEGKDVIGVLPNYLACHANSITEIPLNLPPELRGQELSLEQIEEFAREPVTYKIEVVEK